MPETRFKPVTCGVTGRVRYWALAGDLGAHMDKRSIRTRELYELRTAKWNARAAMLNTLASAAKLMSGAALMAIVVILTLNPGGAGTEVLELALKLLK